MPVKHDLYQDLGLSKEVVHERRRSDDRLNSLLEQYDAADKEVVVFESSGGADDELEKLKKKRLSVKDKIVLQLAPTTGR
ncbi:YdcH family protein [Pseudomonas sp. M5A4_2d]|jgi:hypothetical protein|uniref:DUF465 domain-containing protein n=1 Tax=Pseudomonas antarctica TaxID=219572 RepID=A0A172Z024_9PSED|nr:MULTISPECIES: YdcH family protein [Pseudomonas]MBX7276239.1 YdcH family protein [Pseudomonas sp. ERGC3:01]OAE11204.1 hypothetical protein AZH11_22005 [Pseudomonas simiae]QZC93548.1 YdcH family protein [Pseudomonas sp. ERGC3:05]ANF85764.1 hypothetical protein A7J50_2357 [Pseudomonas antarctica]UXV21989.1 YdcH family protein [Pseudomonas fluorescens]